MLEESMQSHRIRWAVGKLLLDFREKRQHRQWLVLVEEHLGGIEFVVQPLQWRRGVDFQAVRAQELSEVRDRAVQTTLAHSCGIISKQLPRDLRTTPVFEEVLQCTDSPL